MRLTRLEDSLDEDLSRDLPTYALREPSHMLRTETAIAHRAMIERPDIVLYPDNVRAGLSIKGPDLRGIVTPDLRDGTRAARALCPIVAHHGLESRQIPPRIAATVTVSYGDPGIDGIPYAQFLHLISNLE
jgi:hypothetical protein